MAYDDNFIDDGFGIDTDNQDPNLIDEELMGSTSPNGSTKDITLADDDDKSKAKKDGRAESAEEKADRLALEAREKQKEAAEKLRSELEEGLYDEEDEENEDGDESKKSKKVKKAGTTDPVDTVDDDTISSIAEGLYKAGILTKDSDDEEIPTTQDEFVEKFNSEKEKAAEQLVYDFAGKFGEEFRDVFNAIFVDGASPKEYLTKFNEVESYKDMDLTDEDNQVKVVEAALRKQQWEEVDIKDKIKSLKLNSELESDAIKYHKALVKSEEGDLIKIRERDRVKQEQKKASKDQYKAGIRSILADKLKTKDFEGIPLSKEDANKTLAFLEDEKWKLPTGELITDYDYAILELNKPQNYATKVKLGLLLAKVFQPNKPITLDLSTVVKTAVSKEKTELFNFTKKAKKESINNSKDEDDFRF